MGTLGERIKELRKGKGISQEELAFELEVSRQTIHKWENNITQPSTEKLKMISMFFEVNPNLFLSEKEILTEDEVAIADSQQINKKGLVIKCIIVSFTLLFLVMILILTVGSGLIAFTKNTGHERVVSFYVDASLFYMLLSLSIILFALNIILVIRIIKTLK